MGRVLGAAIVPSAPLVLPAVAAAVPAPHAGDVAALRAAAVDALDGLPPSDAVVLVASGRRGVHAAARADLGPLGFPEVRRRHPVVAQLLPDVTSRTQFAQRPGDDLDVDLAVLALQLPAATPVLPIAVAVADGAALAAIGRAVASAVRDGALDVTLVCAGDLSAALDISSPRYHVEGASEWDERTLAAVRDADLGRLVDQEQGAQRVHARSWAPLVVAVAAARAAGLQPAAFEHHTVRGVGHLVGSFTRP